MDWMRTHAFVLLLGCCVASSYSSELGSPCSKDAQCKVKDSHCMAGTCTCKHYYAQFNSTVCLESKLLGRECLINEQCSLRVAHSICKEGHCHCSEGFVRFRKHTCLGPAKIGNVCYSDEHCQLWTKNSHCMFLIPKLFGKCTCDGEGPCKSDETTQPPQNNTETEVAKPEANTTPTKSPTIKEEALDEKHKNEWANPPQTEPPFTDPFLLQKEHLQESIPPEVSTEKPPEDTITEGLWNEKSEEGVTNSQNEEEGPEATTALGEMSVDELPPSESKYRVEANDKEAASSTWDLSNVEAVSLGYSCRSDPECQKSDNESRCLDGICDCLVKENGTNVCGRDNTGCGPETFQCRSSGTCISWFFVCDGRNDCPDKSDEECSGPKCPEPSFQCESNGSCVSLAAICDGVKNCLNGEDERFCKPHQRNATQGCPENSFQCASGECLPKFEFCNATPKCVDGSDESPQLCTNEALKKASKKGKEGHQCPFECGNKRCRSTAIVCSGRDGCGDNSDEAHCSVCRCPKSHAN